MKNLYPPMNMLTTIGPTPHLWRVCYHNEGKSRVSLEYVGLMARDAVILPDGRSLSLQEFEAMRRAKWPLAHEDGRNPKNITLGVRSGGISGQSQVKA